MTFPRRHSDKPTCITGIIYRPISFLQPVTTSNSNERARHIIAISSLRTTFRQSAIPRIRKHEDAVGNYTRYAQSTEECHPLAVVTAWHMTTGMSILLPASMVDRKPSETMWVEHTFRRQNRQTDETAFVVVLHPADVDVLSATPHNSRMFRRIVLSAM